MAEESDQSVVAVLVEEILPRVPGVVDALERGIDVLDVGCGSGRALNLMAQTFPRSRFTGYDLSAEGIGAAKAEARASGLSNASFAIRDVSELEIGDAFDLITAFDAIHDQAQPDAVLRGIGRALRADGVFLMQDIAGSSHVHEDRENAMAPFLYTVSCMHCMTVSLAADGAGLGAMWGRDLACRMLAEAGFGRVSVHELPHDALNYYYVARK
jgi:2-polyprenyl-3-methyl-5-hydroxy-6-metoxy-1,4-benzoquinol methylase